MQHWAAALDVTAALHAAPPDGNVPVSAKQDSMGLLLRGGPDSTRQHMYTPDPENL